jgi:hypothetical protein
MIVMAAAFCSGVFVGSRQLFPYNHLASAKKILTQNNRRLLAGKKDVSSTLLDNKSTMVALAFGQSNAANYGETPFPAVPGVYNFFEGKLYEAGDPMLGASGIKGSIWTRLGKKIVDRAFFKNIVFITIAEGNSEIERWAAKGDLNKRLINSIREAQRNNLSITHLLWYQGEKDAAIGTSTEAYTRMFREMLDSIRSTGCRAPLYVAVATRGSGRAPNAQIRRAQKEVVSFAQSVYPGPDTDELGYAYRYDGTHFSSEGLDMVADKWMKSLFEKTH